MAIRCGNCKGQHQSVAEVRSCYGGAIRSQSETSVHAGPGLITPKQYELVKSLLAERDVPRDPHWTGERDGVLNLERAAQLTKRDASTFIDFLMRCPKRAQVRPTLANTAPVNPELAGTYTVVLNGDEDYVTLKFEHAAKWADGKTVVSFLSGSTNEASYTGFAFLEPTGLRVWKRFKEDSRLVAAVQLLVTGNVDEAHERFLNLAEAYALRSGRCMRCGHKLTVPASLHRGLGPECAGIEGIR